MKIRIYSCEYPIPISATRLQKFLDQVPSSIQRKVEKFNRWEDAYGCLFGKILLVQACHDARLSVDLDKLLYTKFGKPYFSDGPHFNTSHSGNHVVCVISDIGRIGIDFEKIQDVPVRDYRSTFTQNEWLEITHSSPPLERFYHFWTAKESVLKADGQGLNIPLFDIKIEGRNEIWLDGRFWTLDKIGCFPNYACHIAYEGEHVAWDLTKYSIY